MKIVCDATVFDALRKAGLLVEIPPTKDTPWPTWGYDQEEDNRIECTLVEGAYVKA